MERLCTFSSLQNIWPHRLHETGGAGALRSVILDVLFFFTFIIYHNLIKDKIINMINVHFTNFRVYNNCISSYVLFLLSLVIESHPDNALEDLRLDQPFDDFKNHIKSYDLASMEKKVCPCGRAHQRTPSSFHLIIFLYSHLILQDHSHTPWIIIVAKFLEKWFSEVGFSKTEFLIILELSYCKSFTERDMVL